MTEGLGRNGEVPCLEGLAEALPKLCDAGPAFEAAAVQQPCRKLPMRAWIVPDAGVLEQARDAAACMSVALRDLRPNVRGNLPAEARSVSLDRDDASMAADQAYAACRSGSG